MPKRRWQLAQANTAEYLQQVPALELLNLLPAAVIGVGLLGEIVDGIARGDFMVAPWNVEKACRYCDLKGICPTPRADYVERRVPKATRTARTRRRSRSCSSAPTSNDAPIRSRTATALA